MLSGGTFEASHAPAHHGYPGIMTRAVQRSRVLLAINRPHRFLGTPWLRNILGQSDPPESTSMS